MFFVIVLLLCNHTTTGLGLTLPWRLPMCVLVRSFSLRHYFSWWLLTALLGSVG